MIEVDVRLRRGDFTLAAAFASTAGVTALFGPSGSGKSTLIHLIAGLERPDAGRIVVDGRALADTAAGVYLPAHRRRVGLVFQDAQLFPHMSVRSNLLFGRRFAPQDAPRVDMDRVVATLGIAGLIDRRPGTLSGGERQRVAIGRALLAAPRLILMDEPLASLDAARRMEILPLIEHLRDAFQVPIVYVSHQVEEVARLAGTVVVLESGRVAAVGPPNAVLHPARFGGRFEVASVLEGVVAGYDEAFGLSAVTHPAGTIVLAGQVGPPGRRVRVVVRGTEIALALGRPEGLTIRTALAGTIASITPEGEAHVIAEVTLPGGESIAAVVTRRAVADLNLAPGLAVTALVKTAALDERPLKGS